ncbi:hypothetical protein PUN28_017766 [Cardiocondyla obscurior]|uniref:Uncharacterized protein n=1 Tax=Cardiocondyla obscurior TaxID=286306 RepID=A0AAW2EMZ8_9HYME
MIRGNDDEEGRGGSVLGGCAVEGRGGGTAGGVKIVSRGGVLYPTGAGVDPIGKTAGLNVPGAQRATRDQWVRLGAIAVVRNSVLNFGVEEARRRSLPGAARRGSG